MNHIVGDLTSGDPFGGRVLLILPNYLLHTALSRFR